MPLETSLASTKSPVMSARPSRRATLRWSSPPRSSNSRMTSRLQSPHQPSPTGRDCPALLRPFDEAILWPHARPVRTKRRPISKRAPEMLKAADALVQILGEVVAGGAVRCGGWVVARRGCGNKPHSGEVLRNFYRWRAFAHTASAAVARAVGCRRILTDRADQNSAQSYRIRTLSCRACCVGWAFADPFAQRPIPTNPPVSAGSVAVAVSQ